MSDDKPWSRLQHSRGGWSKLEIDDEDSSLDHCGEGGLPVLPARYEWQDIVGSGGIGTVHLVYDRLLERDVAYKQVHVTTSRLQQQRLLTWEARITARLEHPAIVPVYDASESQSGLAFYTMRIVRGASLSRAIQTLRDESDVAGLLRSYIAVCKGVAYAHSRGVVHRDLKPSNIMLGAFGEVQIVDWGLAELFQVQGAALLPETHAKPARDGSGTPGYASPEQRAGAAADPSGDVYSLGVMLGELATSVSEPSPALMSISAKAVSPPKSRYSSALELSAEIERFLDGHAVEAHPYSVHQLVGRWVSRNRWPLALLFATLVSALTVLALNYGRLVRDRGRAIEAEEEAIAAVDRAREELERTEQALGLAFEGRAAAEFLLGAIPEAERMASNTISHRESPVARGVLSAAYAQTRPRTVQTEMAAGCAHTVLAEDAAVCLDDGRVRLLRGPLGSQEWDVDFDANQALIAGSRLALRGPMAVSIRDLRTGQELLSATSDYPPTQLVASPDGEQIGGVFRTRVFRLSGTSPQWSYPCGDLSVQAIALGDDHVAAVCAGETLRMVDFRGVSQTVVSFGATDAHAFGMALGPGDRKVAIGTIDGRLIIFDTAAAAFRGPWKVADRPVGRIAFINSEQLLIRPDGGIPRLIDLRTPQVPLRLPRASGGEHFIAGESLTTYDRDAAWTWSFSEAFRPASIVVDAGIASVAFSPDGQWVALARGDGIVSVRSLRDGGTIADVVVSTSVIKSIAIRDSTLYAGVASRDGIVAIDTTSWAIRRRYDGVAVQRLANVGNEIFALSYGTELLIIDGSGDLRSTRIPRALDLAATHSGDALLLGRDGMLHRIVDGNVSDLGMFSFSRAVTGGPSLPVIALERAFRIGSALVPVEDLIDAIALSPDGRYIVIGLRRGVTEVWSASSPRRLATMGGAQGRISWVGFAVDGRLASASWDGVLRLYDLRAIDAAPQAIAQEAFETWGQASSDDGGELSAAGVRARGPSAH